MLTPHRYLLLLGLLVACTPDQPAAERTALKQTPKAVQSTPTALVPAPADTLVEYEWDFDACIYTARYNPRRYTKAQLDTTQMLLFRGVETEGNYFYFHSSNPANLNLDTLAAVYQRKRQRYQNMRLVEQPIWLALKKEALQEIEDDYQLKKLTIQALADPSVLLAADYSSGCKKYIYNLARHNDSLMLKDWRNLAEEQQKESNDPERVMERFNYEYRSEERLQLAKDELLKLGWLNCADKKVRRVRPTQEREKQFQQLFTHLKVWCDDV